jgi:hypothetical protein
MRSARNRELSVPRACEQAPNQRSKFLIRQHCKPQQPRMQPLELTLRHRVEVQSPNALVGTRALQPTQENLGSTEIRVSPDQPAREAAEAGVR